MDDGEPPLVIEAIRRFLKGLPPKNPPGDDHSPASMIAAHLADVVDERVFEKVYAEVYAEVTETPDVVH